MTCQTSMTWALIIQGVAGFPPALFNKASSEQSKGHINGGLASFFPNNTGKGAI